MSILDGLVNGIQRIVQKIKEFFRNRYVRVILICGTIAGAAYAVHKYVLHHKLYGSHIPVRPALPLYGTVSTFSPEQLPIFPPKTNRQYLNPLQRVVSIIIPQHFGTIKAASPIEPQLPSIPDKQLAIPHSSRIGQIMKYGFPGMDNIISYKDYVVSYDRRNKVPHWVFEHLTVDSVRSNKEVDRSKCQFKEEPHIHPYFRSTNNDYKRSGFDRGHLAAAGNHKSCQEYVEETFFLSNIAPQVGEGFNRDSWNKLEKYVRKLTKKYPNVYCCTGPLYLPQREFEGKTFIRYQVIGPNMVAVPTHFFKVVVGEKNDGTLDMECYVMENSRIDDDTEIKQFQVNPNLVERAAGLLFFNSASKQRLLTINGAKAK